MNLILNNLRFKSCRKRMERWLQKKHEQHQVVYFSLLRLAGGYNVVIEFYQDVNNSSKFLAAERESYSAKFLKQRVEEWEQSTIEK